jgi:hypothetical protein
MMGCPGRFALIKHHSVHSKHHFVHGKHHLMFVKQHFEKYGAGEKSHGWLSKISYPG